ncbi:DNA modification methylase [Vicingaceae bacterium]|nr:DNA modification methylase [Vicingaceae bacterium]
MELKVKEEFKKLIPPLTKEEFKQLEDNCLAEGIREKILLWDGFIIDGHNRYEIATKWSLDFETESNFFKDESAVKEWMILNQFGRRNLSNYQRSVLALELEEVFSKKSKEKEHIRKTTRQKSDESYPEVSTKKELSKVASVSHDTIAKVKKIQSQASEDIKEKLSIGELSINQAYQDIKKEEKQEAKDNKRQEASERIKNITISENIKQGDSLEILNSLEDGCIDIIVTDPPYGIEYVSNRSIDNNAITKRGLLNDGKEEAFKLLDDTCKILLNKTSKDAHLYFFCSWSVFSDFEEIISKYFKIKTPIVWDKGNKGSGDLEYDWGNQTELIIYCNKGKKYVNTRRGNILDIPRLHSSKMVHPTQKPSELIKELLKVSYNTNDFVVDPFMGSGSTIKACNEMNIKSLGIELDKEMFNIANDFING